MYRSLALVLSALLLASCTSFSTPGEGGFTRHNLALKALTTKNYQEYDWTEKSLAFSIALPADWKVTYSTIVDTRGRKVAEFSPGFVLGPADVFGTLSDKGRVLSGPDSESTVLVKERLSVGGRPAVKVSESAITTGGPGPGPERVFIDLYYLDVSKYTFVMAFQYSKAPPEDGTVRRILESVRLAQD